MSLNVLVVDDSSVARSIIIKTLKMSGLALNEIHQASNGQAGLEQLQANWVDLMFADINMPIMNGEEMIERIRQQELYQNLPIIVVSTEGSDSRIGRLKEMGVRFVHKPFAPEDLRDAIMDMTGVQHAG